MFADIVKKNRSYRRFFGDVVLSKEDLTELVGLARLVPSGANAQVLKYFISNDKDTNAKIFETLGWAGYLKEWDGPVEGERPSAYIIMLSDLSLGKERKHDEGIAAQTIMLGAVEKGYGGCILGNVNREKLAANIGLDNEKYHIELVLALGKPKEEVVIETFDGDIKYYRDENQVHHVPKRTLDELIIN